MADIESKQLSNAASTIEQDFKICLAMWIESLYDSIDNPYDNEHVKEIMNRHNLTKEDLKNVIPIYWTY